MNTKELKKRAKTLPSGNLNIMLYDYTDANGKRKYKSLTAPTIPALLDLVKDFEAQKRLSLVVHKEKKARTVGDVCDEYITLLKLSRERVRMSTLEGYEKIRRNDFKHLMGEPVDDLDERKAQWAIAIEQNRITRKGTIIAPKSVINAWGFISGALKTICGKHFDVTLPHDKTERGELPRAERIRAAIAGTSIELPAYLGIHGLRMSEIRGLRCSCVDAVNKTATICRTIVDAYNKPQIVDDTKTEESARIVHLTNECVDLIENTEAWKKYTETGEDGFIVTMNHNQIYGRYRRILQREGIYITFHDLRAVFATTMIELSRSPLTIRVVEREGGWKPGSQVLRKRYTGMFDDFEDDLIERRNALLEGNEMQDEMQNKAEKP